MNAEIELRKWLHRPEKTKIDNLKFGLKAFNAIEFVLGSKHEIIVEYFCEVIESGVKDLSTNDWSTIYEFLQMHWGSNSVSSTMKRRFVLAISNMLAISSKTKNMVLDCSLAVYQHKSLWNFYKNDIESFSQLAFCVLNYYTNFINENLDNIDPETERLRIDKLLEFLFEYVKVMSKSPNFIKTFALTYSVLTEFLLTSRNYFNSFEYFDKFFVIFVSSLSTLSDEVFQKAFKKFYRNEHLSMHSKLMTIDGFIGTHALKSDLKILVISHLLKEYKETHNLLSFEHLLKVLLKRNYDLENLQSELSTAVCGIVEENKESSPNETLSILCATIQLNPTLVMNNVINFVVEFMFMRKSEQTSDKFNMFLSLVIEMYKKLYQTKIFIINLIQSVETYLISHKLSKKLKRKLDDSTLQNDSVDIDTKLVNILLENGESFSNLKSIELWKEILWPEIEYAWPCRIIGSQLINSISLLQPDLSMSVWQTIVYKFNESLSSLVTTDENILFYSDFLSSLICQYLIGSRIAESVQNIKGPKLENLIQYTKSFLKSFAEKILSLEHNPRLMNNFLNLCLNLGNFELMIIFYYPDSMDPETNADASPINFADRAKTLHEYLSSDEWLLIEQRIVNFGKSECKTSMNRLRLQKNQAYNLFASIQARIRVGSNLLTSTLTDSELLQPILNDTVLNTWFVEHLTRDEKQKVVNTILSHALEIPVALHDDYEFMAIFFISLFKEIALTFSSSKSLMSLIDFDKISSINSELPRYFNELMTKDRSLDELGSYRIKKFSEDEFMRWMGVVKTLPSLNLFVEMRQISFCLALLLTADVKATHSEAMMEVTLDYLKSTINYSTSNLGTKLFGIRLLTKILSDIPESRTIFQLIFNETGKQPKDHITATISNLIELNETEKSDFSIELLFIAAEFISNIKVPAYDTDSKIPALKEQIVQIAFDFLKSYDGDRKTFTRHTLQGFSCIIKMYKEKCNAPDFPEEIVKHIKTYLKNASDHDNQYYVSIMKTAFELKMAGKMGEDDVAKISSKYWKVFEASSIDDDDKKIDEFINFEQTYRLKKTRSHQIDAICVILDNKSDNEFMTLLNGIYVDALKADNKDYPAYISKISNLAQCQFQKQKKAIFNEFFRRILNEIILKLSPDNYLSTNNMRTVLCILNAYNAFVTQNRSIFYKQLDDIFSFVFLLKITPFKLSKDNRFQYMTLLWNISELCINLLQNNADSIKSRLTQFTAILKLQLQSICWYGLENSDNYKLEPLEISYLAKLAHKLEKLVFIMVKHNNILQVHQLAPYILCFIIHIMISKSNVTTLQPQIKTHFVNICYSLISICNAKHRGFILRVSTDAERKVYETLVKEYIKYRKFKGSS